MTNNQAPLRKLSKRQYRAVTMLMEAPRTPLEIERKAGCRNGPELIASLKRRRLQICSVPFTVADRDGIACETCRYVLTEGSRELAQALLSKTTALS